jgi:hypothetical protein
MLLRVLPWITEDCIAFLNGIFKWLPYHLGRPLNVLEIGSGNSTLYFWSKGCRIVSIESDKDYTRAVKDIIKVATSRDSVTTGAATDPKLCDSSLETINATKFDDIPAEIWTRQFDLVVNNGIFRHECLEKIVKNFPDALIIQDNLEYCSNIGDLMYSAGYPERIASYREVLRSEKFEKIIFEQPEGRDGFSQQDATGWECPLRWMTAAIWSRQHPIFSKSLLTNKGFPVISKEGFSDEDIKTVRERSDSVKRIVRGFDLKKDYL